MRQDHGRELRQAFTRAHEAIAAISKNIDEQTDGPFEQRATVKIAVERLEDVETEGEVLLALVNDLIISLGQVRKQRDEAIRHRRAAIRYVRNRDSAALDELVSLLADAGYPQ